MKSTFALLALALLSTPSLAQSDVHGGPKGQSPYAGMEQREITALSDEQIADLRAGRGMSLALPAEVNGYPGPRHVLERAGLDAGSARVDAVAFRRDDTRSDGM